MPRRQRLALATPRTGPEPSTAALAILAAWNSSGRCLQHFRARACLTATEAVAQVTGLPSRHLDAWLMPPDVLRQVFLRGFRRADVALVEGTLDPTPSRSPVPRPYDCMADGGPGELGPIVKALDLPIVALVPFARLAGFHLPCIPPEAEALILDGLEKPHEYEHARAAIEFLTGKPVVGAVEALPDVRDALHAARRDHPLPPDLLARLAASFREFANWPALETLARSRPPLPEGGALPVGPPAQPFRVAFAHDEAFGGYFPDTLETLEALGADLAAFSPLRSERLPAGVDLVMVGCGVPDHYADALARNYSLINALKSHVCQGQRIYSEGGGTAYLGRSMRINGRDVPGADILPIVAELRPEPAPPTPVRRVLTRASWLGPTGTEVRGYRSERWSLSPAAFRCECLAASGPLTSERDWYFRHHAVGSLLHLHLAALPQVVSAFVGPHPASLTVSRGRVPTDR